MNPWVLATRSEVELAELRESLAPHAIDVLAYPTLCEQAHHAPQQWATLRRRFDDARCIAFTSARAPSAVLREAEPYALAQAIVGIPAAAVGKATATSAAAAGFRVVVIGDAGGERLAEMLHPRLNPGAVAVHACGSDHREDLASGLRRRGHEVLELPVYAMSPAHASELPPLPEVPPCAVLLSSPNAARAYLRHVRAGLLRVPHIAMGPATAAALHGSAIPVVVLERPTADAIVEELCQICS
ncbi:MAG: uroporphyrinogen-III synthase [Acidobacteriota bacterium]